MAKERGILFDPDLAQKVHLGLKTVTRRLVKPQPGRNHYLAEIHQSTSRGMTLYSGFYLTTYHGAPIEQITCPYGGPGDLLYVRERHFVMPNLGDDYSRGGTVHHGILFPGQFKEVGLIEPKRGWSSGMHLPKDAARTWLKIKSIRVERVQDIHGFDLFMEGFRPGRIVGGRFSSSLAAFRESWNARYPGSWDRNDWVWVIEFEKVDHK